MPTRPLIAAAVALILASGGYALWRQASGSGPDRNTVLKTVAEQVIIPAYKAFEQDAGTLAGATTTLCTDPSLATLNAARSAWLTTRTAWKKTESYNFGPAKTLRLESAIDFWPLRPWMIDAELAKATPVDDVYVKTLGNAVRGLPAIEYMLFGDKGDELVKLGKDSRNCQYVQALARAVQKDASALIAAWEGATGYAHELATAGSGSKTFPKLMDAINVVINHFVAVSRTIEDAKLGRPLGKRYGNMPQPEMFESPVSGHAFSDIIANLEGMRQIYGGATDDHELGWGDLVPQDKRAVNDLVLKAIQQSEAALRALNMSPADAAEKALADDAFKQAVALNHILNADLVSVLGVTPTFSDNDGD